MLFQFYKTGIINFTCDMLIIINMKGVSKFMENKNIECSVQQCKNHSSSSNYCALDKISVGTHETNPTQPQCTDCMSFQIKTT